MEIGFFHDRFFETSTSFSQMLPKKSSRNGLLSVLYVTCSPGEKLFLPVEPQSGLSFLFLLGAPRFA